MSLKKTLWRAGEVANALGYYGEAIADTAGSLLFTLGTVGLLIAGAQIEMPVLAGGIALSFGLRGISALFRRKFNKDMFRLTESKGAPSIKTSERWFNQNIAKTMPLVEGLTAGAIGATIAGFGAVSVGLPLTLGVGAFMLGSALATGAVSYLITKAEVSQYEALGTRDPRQESDCWLGAKVARFLRESPLHSVVAPFAALVGLDAHDKINSL